MSGSLPPARTLPIAPDPTVQHPSHPDGHAVGLPVIRCATGAVHALRTLVLLVGLLPFAPAQEAEPPVDVGASDFPRLVARHCGPCHGGERPKAGVDLTSLEDPEPASPDRDPIAEPILVRALARVRDGTMPPPGRKTLDAATRDRLARGLEARLSARPARRPVLRRLSPAQYARSVFAVTGVVIDPVALPPESPAYGSESLGDVMSVSPLHFEIYDDLAAAIAARMLAPGEARSRLFAPTEGRPPQTDDERRAVLAPLVSRAFRRPATAGDLDRRVAMARELGLADALRSILVSPSFLFRIERGTRPASSAPADPLRLDGHELATRLAFFATGATPDDALRALADDGALGDVDRLVAEARRLLAGPTARAFVEDTFGPWLRYREARDKAADFRRFPDIWDQGLKDAMVEETTRFLEALVREDRSLLLLLDSRTTFLNARLARHYRIDGVTGSEFREVELPDRRRGGLTGMASVLFVTSLPLRTSPTLRGAWILDALLGDPPPPPPANAGVLPADDRQPDGLTLRERLDRHRRDPSCASCHARIDPLGFALENFDALGRWRAEDDERLIDTAGVLPDGTPVDGPGALRAALLARKDEVVRNLARRLFLAAVGRLPGPQDQATIDDAVRAAQAADYRFSSVVLAIVRSDAFRTTMP